MRDKIWYEFVHTKYGDTYLCLYLSRQKSIRKWTKILTLIFSTSGILGWRIFKLPEFTEVSCFLISVVQLFHLIENQIVLSEKDIVKITDLRTLYLKQCNKLEKLWVDFQANRINDKEVSEAFFKLREEANKIEALDNKLNIKSFKRLKQEADSQVNSYISQYHST